MDATIRLNVDSHQYVARYVLLAKEGEEMMTRWNTGRRVYLYGKSTTTTWLALWWYLSNAAFSKQNVIKVAHPIEEDALRRNGWKESLSPGLEWVSLRANDWDWLSVVVIPLSTIPALQGDTFTPHLVANATMMERRKRTDIGSRISRLDGWWTVVVVDGQENMGRASINILDTLHIGTVCANIKANGELLFP